MARVLIEDEARRLAGDIAKPPALMNGAGRSGAFLLYPLQGSPLEIARMGLKTASLATFALLMSLSAASAVVDIGGRYRDVGTNLDGSQYSGTADITITSDPIDPVGRDKACRIVWHTGGDDLIGICMRGIANFIGAYIDGEDVVLIVYKIDPDGTLRGEWTVANHSGYGTDVLTPDHSANPVESGERPSSGGPGHQHGGY